MNCNETCNCNSGGCHPQTGTFYFYYFLFSSFSSLLLLSPFCFQKANARVALDGLEKSVRRNAMDVLMDKIVVWNVIVILQIHMHVMQ